MKTSKGEHYSGEINTSGLFAYDDLFSSHEKAYFLLAEIKRFFRFDHVHSAEESSRVIDERRAAKLQAIMSIMHVFPDGTPVPLPLSQRLWYGTVHEKLASYFASIEAKADDIVQEAAALDYAGLHDHLDVFLTQHFVLEQMTLLKRYILSRQFFIIRSVRNHLVDPSMWLGSWIIIFSVGRHSLSRTDSDMLICRRSFLFSIGFWHGVLTMGDPQFAIGECNLHWLLFMMSSSANLLRY
jgi:hypothetical protein